MTQSFSLSTKREGFHDITEQVREAVRRSGVRDGICVVYCPHTTAGLTINENADPDVTADLLIALERSMLDRPEFRHAEGNSAAHFKASLFGSSVTILVDGGQPLLGTWQGIYFVEFDGPRSRKFQVQVMGNAVD